MVRRIACWLGVLSIGLAHAQVGFSPQYYDLDLVEAQKTHAFRLFNFSKEDKVVHVSVVNWDFDAQGEIRLLPTTDTSLDQWVVVNPVDFTIPAGQAQAVRFAVRPAIELPAGEHRAMLIFDEVPQAQPLAAPADKGRQTALRARFQFRSAIYCQVGQPKRTAEFELTEATGKGFRFQLVATGTANTRLDGQFQVWSKARYPGLAHTTPIGNLTHPKPELPDGVLLAGILPSQPVLPGGRRDYAVIFEKPLAPGAYVVALLGNLGDAKLSREVALAVPAH
jgi:hypothetical protein